MQVLQKLFKGFKKEYFWVPKERRLKDATQVGLVQLAFPIILETLLRSLVGTVDVVFLSRISDMAVSAVSISNQLIMFTQIIATALATGATVCINQAIGMHNKDKVNLYSTMAVTANAFTGILFGLVFAIIPQIPLKIMTLEADAIEAAMRYMRIVGGTMIIQTVEIVLMNLCRSMGRIKAPLIINFLSNLVNVVGNYLAVYHSDWFWNVDPVVGVAIATVLSRITALVIAIILVRKEKVRISPKLLKPFPKENFKLIIDISIPGGLNNMAYSMSQLVTTSIITMLGITMVTAKVYAQNIVHYAALFCMSFSQANSLMVGYRLGAGKVDEAKEVRSIVTKIALLSNCIISLGMLTLRYPLLGIFTTDPEIIELASAIFFIDFFVEIGRALNQSVNGALQAAGDVKFLLVVNQAGGWILAVGGSYLFAIVLGMGLSGVWIAFACDELIRGTAVLLRWRSGQWIESARAKRRIIETSEK